MQLYQDKVGKVTVRIVPTEAFSEQDANEIIEKMEKAAGARISVRVECVDNIPRTRRGKYRFLEQKLEIRYGEQKAADT
jgi:phenylacetate-CoA ligase